MAVTYTWVIQTVENTIATGGIDTIHWRCNAVDGDHSAGNYGTVNCTPDPDASDFIAYADVTEANVLGWVQAVVGKDVTETKLQAMIDEKKAPTTATGVPW